MGDSYKNHLYALIICGGAGTRLWPRSLQKTPKQFLEKFYGEETLFSQTVERAKLLTTNDRIFVVTLSDYVDEILQQGTDILAKNIIAEPFGKNTAMAVGLGAVYIRQIDKNAVIMNFWSDAAISDNNLFAERLNLAAKIAFEMGLIVDVGLKPTFPHTGLGYVEAGRRITASLGEVYEVKSFKEKPDLKTAEEYLNKGNYYWNTGIYVWSVRTIFDAFSKYSPNIYNQLEEISKALGTERERETIRQVYDKADNISIDVAVSEKAENLALVPATFSWSDIGDWKVAYDLKEKDDNGNVVEVFGKEGWHLGIETKNCLIEIQDKLVATVGVTDLIIVQTEKAILIGSQSKSQEVKQIVNRLKEKGKTEYL